MLPFQYFVVLPVEFASIFRHPGGIDEILDPRTEARFCFHEGKRFFVVEGEGMTRSSWRPGGAEVLTFPAFITACGVESIDREGLLGRYA